MALEKRGADWHLRPLGQRAGELQLWRAYSREEIPPLFGLEFSTAIWNVGFVKRPGHICLLVTLDKGGHGEDFQYKDHFTSPTEFEWQSQNRTGQASADGQDIQNHAARGIAVHLFVRSQKKRAAGGAAPFAYCGDVEFVAWRGDKPITVQWKLPEAVPARLRGDLACPPPAWAQPSWREGSRSRPVGDSDIINGLAPAHPDATRIDLPLQSIVAVAFAERRGDDLQSRPGRPADLRGEGDSEGSPVALRTGAV